MKEEQMAFFERGMLAYGMNSKKMMKKCIAYLAEELEKEKANCDLLLIKSEELCKEIEEKEKEIYELKDSLERQMKEYGLAIARKKGRQEKGTCETCSLRGTLDCPRVFMEEGNGKFEPPMFREKYGNDKGICEKYMRGRTGNGQAEV